MIAGAEELFHWWKHGSVKALTLKLKNQFCNLVTVVI